MIEVLGVKFHDRPVVLVQVLWLGAEDQVSGSRECRGTGTLTVPLLMDPWKRTWRLPRLCYLVTTSSSKRLIPCRATYRERKNRRRRPLEPQPHPHMFLPLSER